MYGDGPGRERCLVDEALCRAQRPQRLESMDQPANVSNQSQTQPDTCCKTESVRPGEVWDEPPEGRREG